MVKNPDAKEQEEIHYYDIGDYLGQTDKLKIIEEFKSIDGITSKGGWQSIIPDKHNDWLNQRDDSFDILFRELGGHPLLNLISTFMLYNWNASCFVNMHIFK